MDINKRITQAVKDFDNLDVDDCQTLVLAAASLSLEECYDLLLVDANTLSAEEQAFALRLHRHGRATGIKDAAAKLFLHMSTRNGGQSALEYLKQFSGDFSVEVQTTQSKGFSFNINIPEVKE